MTNGDFIRPLTSAVTTYSEAVCHAGQHIERIYTMLILHHDRTHTKRSDMDHITQFYLQITPCLPCFASVHQMAPPLTEVEALLELTNLSTRRDERLSWPG